MQNPDPEIRLKALDLKTKHALVIDENEHTRKILIELLRSFGVQRISTSPSTTHALDLLRSVPTRDLKFDFVFCNWTQPPLDSAEFAIAVRARGDKLMREVPIIVLKAAAKISEVVAARDAGVTEFLAVPLTGNALLQVLENTILRKRQFVEATKFVGPDRRRRRNENDAIGRRGSDASEPVSKG